MTRRRHVDRPAYEHMSLRLSRSDAHPRLDDEGPYAPGRRGRERESS